MSLPRNNRPEQTLHQLPTSLDDLWEQMLALRQGSAQAAEDKCQVALLLATVNKLCSEQTAFLSEAKSMLDMININQVEMCCQLEQYKKGIADDAKALLKSLYISLKENQKKAFDEITKNNSEVMLKVLADTALCADKIHKAAEHAKDTTKKLFRMTKITDLVFYITPAAVLADLIFRVIQFFA